MYQRLRLVTFVLCGLLSSGNDFLRKDPTKEGRNIALQALFPLLSRPFSADLSPRGNFFGSFAPWDFFFFLFPPFRGAGGEAGVSGCTWCCVWGGSLSSRSTSVQREGWECLWAFVWGGRARSRFSFSFGSGRSGSCPLAADAHFPHL